MENKRDIVKKRLNGLFREIFEDDGIEISDSTTAKDVDGWDSLTHVILVVAVEKEFGLRLNAAEVGRLQNVGEMLNILVERATR